MGIVWDPTRSLVLLGVPEQQKFFPPQEVGDSKWALLAMCFVLTCCVS